METDKKWRESSVSTDFERGGAKVYPIEQSDLTKKRTG